MRVLGVAAVVGTLLVLAVAQRRAGGRSRPWSGRPAPFRSWDSLRYRPWQEGAPRQPGCWRGGDVTFDISNDAPTMAGAEATFSIALHLPSTAPRPGTPLKQARSTAVPQHVVPPAPTP